MITLNQEGSSRRRVNSIQVKKKTLYKKRQGGSIQKENQKYHHRTEIQMDKKYGQSSVNLKKKPDSHFSDRKIKKLSQDQEQYGPQHQICSYRRKYFLRSNPKKYTANIRNSQLKSERKLTNYNQVYSKEHKKQTSQRRSLLSQRSYRLHTIDQISNQNLQQTKQEIIKGCIASLQNILKDLTQNKQNKREQQKFKQKKSHKQIFKINKTADFHPQGQQQKKLNSIKTDVDQICHPLYKGSKIFKRNKKYQQNQQRAQEYLLMENNQYLEQKQNKIFKQQDGISNTQSINQNIMNNLANKQFKSYIEYIKNKKRDNQIQRVKKIRKNQTLTKKDTPSLKIKYTQINKRNQVQIFDKNQLQFVQEVQETKKKKKQEYLQELRKMNEDNLELKTKKFIFKHQNQAQFSQKNLQMNQLSMSSIEKVNDSSFLSQWGKKALKQQGKIINGSVQNEINAQKITQDLILKKISQKSPSKKQRKKQRKLASKNNLYDYQQNFPKGFFQ